MKIGFQNVRGLGSSEFKRKRVLEEIERNDFDCFAICEANLGQSKIQTLRYDMEASRSYITIGAFDKCDIILDPRHPSKEKSISVVCVLKNCWAQRMIKRETFCSRAINLHFNIRSMLINLIFIHRPNNNTSEFDRKIKKWISEARRRGARVLVIGDHNYVQCKDRDRKRNYNIVDSISQGIEAYEEFEFIDIWRMLHPNELAFTHICQTSAAVYKSR